MPKTAIMTMKGVQRCGLPADDGGTIATTSVPVSKRSRLRLLEQVAQSVVQSARRRPA
jgi:hypothetical protein